MSMFDRLEELEERYEKVIAQLNDPSVHSDPNQLRTLGRQRAALEETTLIYRKWKEARAEVESARSLLANETDEEFRQLVQQEVEEQQRTVKELEEKLKVLMLPKDPNDDRDVIVDIKAGEGGEESALFAADLYRMYQRYAERRGWKTEALSSGESSLGGLKEVTFAVKGQGAYSRLKHEAGVHRVQRIPATESQGRIHTSAAGVLVMPEAEEVEVKVDPQDLHIDVFRSSGPGGQSVNTTDSAVRITHKPSGIVVTCQDERSQLQNREKAMRILRALIYQQEVERQMSEQSDARRSQVKSVDRSEKIRTYNFPQNRVTDHRVKVSSHNLPEVMDGGIDVFIDALITKERAEGLGEER